MNFLKITLGLFVAIFGSVFLMLAMLCTPVFVCLDELEKAGDRLIIKFKEVWGLSK